MSDPGDEMRLSKQKAEGANELPPLVKIWSTVHNLSTTMRHLPAVFIAAILVCVSAVQDVTRLTQMYKDANQARREWFNRLHPNGRPDFSKLKKSRAGTPETLDSSYSSAGFVAFSYFSDDQCSEALFTTGFPVNTCYIEVGYAYMVRLTRDSCLDGVVEYFFDKECTDYAGSSDLTESPSMNPCSSLGGGYFAGTVCTTSDQPKVYAESVVQRYYRGGSCGDTDSYLAFPANQCSESDDGSEDFMFTCDGGLQQVSYVAGSNCGQRTGTQSIPAMCYQTSGSSDDDDDGFDDDRTNERLPAPTVRGRGPSTAAAATAQFKAKANANARSAMLKTKSPLRPADSKQALDLVPTDDDVNYDDDHGDDRVYYYDDGTYSSGYGYSYDDSVGGDFLNPPPSVSTTAFPTTTAEANAANSIKLMCQSAPATSTVVFTAKQTIDGVSYSDYTDNANAYEKTFKQAIASAITGATEDSVTDLLVTAGTSSSAVTIAMSRAPGQFIKRMLSGGSSLALSYTVTIYGTTLSTDELMGQLVTAVETGAFTEAMQSYAAENGAEGLETATSDSVTTEGQDDGGDKKTLSDGAIIGIAVGVGVPVIAAFIFAIVYCCSTCGRGASNTTATTAAPGVQAAPGASAPPQEVQLVPQGASAEATFVGHNPTYAAVEAQPYNPKADARPAIEVSAV